MKRHQWADPKANPNRWSHLKKIYDRIKLRMKDIAVESEDDSEWERAASWLDKNERQEMSLAKYVTYLRGLYYGKRKK